MKISQFKNISKISLKKYICIFLISIFIILIVLICHDILEQYNSISNINILSIDSLGDTVLDISEQDLEDNGFEFGDSVDIVFSNGETLEDIPYCKDWYGPKGKIELVAMPNIDVKIGGQYMDLSKEYDLSTNLTVSIYCRQKYAYLNELDLYQLNISNDQSDYINLNMFSNFRSINPGSSEKNSIYRSASPLNHKYGRAKVLSKYISDYKINTILNLTDKEDDITKYSDMPIGVSQLYKNGQIICAGLGINIYSDDFKYKLCDSLKTFINRQGPYLVHCSLGRDRTGIVCALFESLMGVSYAEISKDYMLSFEQLNFLDKDKEPEKYQVYQNTLDDFFMEITGAQSPEELQNINLSESVRDFLNEGGMTDEQINRLCKILSDENL